MSFPPRQLKDFCNPEEAPATLDQHITNGRWNDALYFACLLSDTEHIEIALKHNATLVRPCPAAYMLIKNGNIDGLKLIFPQIKPNHWNSISIEIVNLYSVWFDTPMCIFLVNQCVGLKRNLTMIAAIKHGSLGFVNFILEHTHDWVSKYDALVFAQKSIELNQPGIALLFINKSIKWY